MKHALTSALQAVPRTVLVGSLTAIALSSLAAANETIRLRSGHFNGAPGGDCAPADDTTCVHKTDASPLSVSPFSPTVFEWSRGATPPPTIGYGTSISRVFDPNFSPRHSFNNARWISWMGSNSSNVGVLHCHTFEVATTAIASATIDLEWAAKPQLGDLPGGNNLDGVYLNGQPIGAAFRGGSPFPSTTATEDIGGLLNVGTNYLYFYVPLDPAGGQSGVTYEADIVIEGPNAVDVFEDNDTCGTAAVIPFGQYDGLSSSYDDEDWYSVTVLPGTTFDARAVFDDDIGDIDLTLFADDCLTVLEISWSFDDIESVSWMNTQATPVKVHLLTAIAITEPLDTCNSYALTIGADTCPGTEDGFDPNDSVPAAYPLGTGTYPNLHVTDTSPDFYSFQVGPTDTFDIEVQFSNTYGDIELALLREDGSLAFLSNSTDNMEFGSWTNPSATNIETVTAVVFLSATSPFPCNDYRLDAEGALEPPLLNIDSAGVFDLEGVGDGSTWCIEVTHLGSTETQTVSGLAVGSTPAEIGDAIQTAVVATGLPVNVSFPNALDHSRFKLVEDPLSFPANPVTIRFGDASCANFCEPTTTDACPFNPVASQLIPFGGPFCTVTPNSTGGASSMTAYGSSVVADNDLLLDTTGLPAGTVGYFVAGNAQNFVPNPGGSQGNLCLSGTILRLVPPSLSTGAAGTLSVQIDVTNVGGQGVAFLPGDTWNFQCWHRDANPSVTSNFSKALFVNFE